VVVESHDDFPGVEISIAGGVGEMVRDVGEMVRGQRSVTVWVLIDRHTHLSGAVI